MHNWFETMWWRHSPPPLWLRCIEPIYSTISQIHLNKRANIVLCPPIPMISVGNITAGGSGKTPFVLWLADQLKQQGHAPVILCRGDGGKNRVPKQVCSDDLAKDIGDEAKMLADLSSCPVIAASDRIAASHMAAELGDVLILDDGFQYRHLGRCCDLVLIPQIGIGNGHQIPAGPLREPVESLSRADMIIRTASSSTHKPYPPLTDKAEWQWLTKPVDIIDIMHSGAAVPESVYAVTAIARPHRFFDDLIDTGLTLAGDKAYPDHHPFNAKDVKQILNLHSDIAITAKDAVKLQALWPKDQPLWLLQQQGSAAPDLLAAIQNYLPSAQNKAFPVST